MKIVYILNKCLDVLGVEADNREDGNTCALLDRIRRDVAQLQPYYNDIEPTIEEDISDAQDEPVDNPVNKAKSDADNPEEKSTGSTKSGKVSKANA